MVMTAPKDQQVKLYIVIALAIVAMAVAYVRFFRGSRPAPGPAAETAGAAVSSFDLDVTVPEIEPVFDGTPAPFRPVERDLFAPAPVHSAEAAAADEPGRPGRRRTLKLKAVMSGSGGRMANISDRLVKEGDRLGRFTVGRISRDRVLLHEGERVYVLRVLE